jgi:hypothetical protein
MKINWGTGIAVFYILFVFAMIFSVVKSSQQNNDLVIDNYYDEAVTYQNIIDESNNASNAKSKLKMEFKSNESAIAIKTEGSETYISGSLSFYKPDNEKNDFKLDFKTDNSGNALIMLKNIRNGFWKVGLSWRSAGKNCLETNKVFIQSQ